MCHGVLGFLLRVLLGAARSAMCPDLMQQTCTGCKGKITDTHIKTIAGWWFQHVSNMIFNFLPMWNDDPN